MDCLQEINGFRLILRLLGLSLIVAATGLTSCGPQPMPSPTLIQVSITAERNVFHGETTKLEASILGRPVEPPNSCFWSATQGHFESSDCEVHYTVPSKPDVDEVTISVDVSNKEGDWIGTGRIKLSISESSHYYFVYILDSSARMNEAFDTGTRLDIATAGLARDIRKYKWLDDNIGLRVFGYTEAHKEECQNTERLVRVGTRTEEEIYEKLKGLTATGESPLSCAICEGIKDLKPEEEDKNYFVITVVGGADGHSCEIEDTQEFLRDQLTRKLKIKPMNLRIDIIGLLPSHEDSGALVRLRDELREVISQTYYYTATTTAGFENLLEYLSRLSEEKPLDLLDQALGYDGLVQALEAQGDVRGVELLRNQQVDQMGFVPDLRQSLVRRGLNSLENGEQQSADEDFTRVIELWKDESAAYLFRGVTRFNLGDYGLAERDFDAAAKLNPDFAMAKYYLGFALIELDDPGFRDAFEEAYTLDSTFFDKPYFTGMTPAYTQFKFYEEATPLEIKQAGQEFFQGPFISSFAEVELPQLLGDQLAAP